MGQTISERLEYLRKANRDRQWVNDDLYRLLYKADLYILAYERIKSKSGNITPGTDGETSMVSQWKPFKPSLRKCERSSFASSQYGQPSSRRPTAR